MAQHRDWNRDQAVQDDTGYQDVLSRLVMIGSLLDSVVVRARVAAARTPDCGPEGAVADGSAARGQSTGAVRPSTVPVVQEALRSSGFPLPSAFRADMEPRFGTSFGDVRLHTGVQAAESARLLHAQAYTVGSHIVFGDQQFAPGTDGGRQLLAHELTHVVQQGGAPASWPDAGDASAAVSEHNDPLEQEAGQVAAGLMRGLPGAVSGGGRNTRARPSGVPLRSAGSSGVLVQRQLVAPSPWTPPVRADELGPARSDRLGARTFDCGPYSIFIPAGAATVTVNRVHVFFSPGDATGGTGSNAAAVHGLRGAADSTEWILISAPSRPAGSNTISDAEIKNCLTSAGRPATIDAVRLSAHSRGAAGLAATLAGRTVTPRLIEHVTVLDASDFAASLTRGLTASGVPASRVTAYNVVFGAFRGAAQNVQLSFGCVRSIGYARLITDGLATGRTPAPLPPGIAARVSALRLPPRGNFSTASPTPAGKTDLNAFCADPVNRAALIAMRDGEPASPTDILSATQRTARAPQSPYAFIEENNVLGFNNNSAPRSTWLHFSPQIYSHHLFVAEIGHEMFS